MTIVDRRKISARAEEQMRRAAAAATHQIALRKGETLPMWIGCGYPKSGTVWLCKMMASYLGVPYPQNYLLPIAMRSVIHAHWEYDARVPPTLYIVRDGRDVLVSLYFYNMRAISLGRNPSHVSALKNRYSKAFGAGFDPQNIRSNLARFIELEIEQPTSVRSTWQEHVLSWRGQPGVTLVKYEDLKRDCGPSLAVAMADLTRSEPDFELAEIVADRHSFSRITRREPGTEDRGSFQRKGISGDWVNHFTREAAEIYDHSFGFGLRELGYVESSDWINEAAV